MLFARVDGSAVATVAHPCLQGKRLAIVQPIDRDGKEEGTPVMAVDPLGAGMHQQVMATTDGQGIREWVGSDICPIRYMITAIVDEVAQP